MKLKTKLFIVSLSMSLLIISPVQAQFENSHTLENLFNEIKAHPSVGLLKSDFGTSTKVTVSSYADFEPIANAFNMVIPGGGAVNCVAYPCEMLAPVNFPDGVKISGYELRYADFDAANNLICLLAAVQHDVIQTVAPLISIAGFVSAGTPGAATSGVVAPVTPHVVDNNTYFYIQACSQSNASRITTARTYWERAISAAPGAASFSDVPPSHPFYQAVEAMVASGVTGGCGGGNYCPDATVTRGQMAAFMARALGL